MKKIFSTILMCLGLLTAVSCVEDQLVIVNPGDIKAPVLNELTGSPYVLDEAAQFETFSFSAANFGYQGAVQYTLYAYLDDITAAKRLAQVTSPATSITVAEKDLNNVLVGYECPADEEVTVNFVVVAQAYGESGVVVGVEERTSNAVAAIVVPYKADKVYEKIFVRGTFNGWNADANHTLSCYAEDGHTYNGIVDFGESRDDLKFKFADANWGDINLGSSDATPEAQTLTLEHSGADIPLYGQYRYYGFTVDVTAKTAKKDWAFDAISVIGAVAGTNWDTDFDMTWNGYNKRFYVDLTLNEGDEYKFRLNHDWSQNWGVGWVAGGDNIKVAEGGDYRVYVYFDNYHKEIKYALDAKMYGQPDENIVEEPVVDTFEGWSLIGMVNGTSWDADVDMTEKDGVFTAVAKVEGDFKIRKDHDWAVNRGGAFVKLGEPFEVVADGANINAGEGLFKVVYDSNNETITIIDVAGAWSLIGAIEGSGWDKDFWMTESDGVWTSDPVTINGEFKVRQNGGWDVNRGAEGDAAVEVEIGKPVAVVGGGANLKVPAEAKYVVTYNAKDETVTVVKALPENAWSLVGEFNGWGGSDDIYLTEYMSGVWVSDVVELSGQFKLRFNTSWDVNRGGVLEMLGVPCAAVQNGDNFSVEAGKYFVVYIPATEKVVISPVADTWSVIGGQEGFGWDNDTPLYKNGDVLQSVPFFAAEGAEIKIRKGADWADNRGGELAALGEPFAVTGGGDNIKVAASGMYYLVYDPANEQITLNGAWSVIGDFNGWSADLVMVYEDGLWKSAPFASNGGFKIRFAGDWAANRGGVFADFGAAFEVAHDGANINPGEGTFTVVYDPKAETITVNKAE